MTEHQLRLRDERADVELVRSAREGDDVAFEVLYFRHLPAIERYGRRHGLSSSEAKSTFGLCLLRCVYRFDTGRDTSFESYLAAAVRNSIRSDHRSSTVWWKRLQRVTKLSVATDLEVDTRLGPEDLATDECARILDAMALLPAIQRVVVRRIALDGAPTDVVAGELGLTKKHVDNIYQRAKRELGKLLPGEMSAGRSHRHRRCHRS